MPFLVPLEVKPSPLGGSGLFAMRDIAKGTKVWVMKPKPDEVNKVVPLTMRVDDPRPVTEPNRLLKEEDMLKIPKDQIRATLWGGYAHEPSQQWIELRDGGSFTNHSDTPNCEAEWSINPEDEHNFAIVDIKAGDEIFEDYGIFHSTKMPWVANLLEEHCADRMEFEDGHATPRPLDIIKPTEE